MEGSETLTFSWDLPLGVEQEEINYFLIDCEPTFQHDISEIVLNGLSATLEKFLPGTTYTCTVQAKADELGAPATQTATTEEGNHICLTAGTRFCLFHSSYKPSIPCSWGN